ncbi:MAG TPA: hypothetical protein VKR52_20265 [Terracidiphilus sp.]|nr:hypothetical protein [Terracidiphilus sp.]
MAGSSQMRFLAVAGMGVLLAAPLVAQNHPASSDEQTTAAPQHQNPVPLKPGVPGTGSNHRLILKDGTYQVVRTYQIVGERVRFLSQERGEWEEMPSDLVDWDATRKWENDHAQSDDADSPAMKEAEELDKEEQAARVEEKQRMPEVAKGLELPDQSGVFVLDTFQGTPELVELDARELDLRSRTRHGLSVLNPMAGAKEDIELPGSNAKVHLHVDDPAIYLSLDVSSAEPEVGHAITVNTNGAKPVANSRHGAQSAQSGFAIVKLDERRAVRLVGAIEVSPTGKVSQSENVIPANVEVLPGHHWMKLTPLAHLTIGEYALVEILSPSDINQTVWDFRVDPRLGDNPAALGPIQK